MTDNDGDGKRMSQMHLKYNPCCREAGEEVRGMIWMGDLGKLSTSLSNAWDLVSEQKCLLVDYSTESSSWLCWKDILVDGISVSFQGKRQGIEKRSFPVY